ncbi:hypothetical protein EBT16_06515 [bacterium]|nr:hypothetical protein [bacterium]
MRSSCPNCLSQTEHSHSEKQVVCSSCGEMYSPFLANSDTPSEESPLADFSESALAFKEIIDFGQSMDQPQAPKLQTPVVAPQKPVRIETSSDFIWTTGDLSPAHRVTQWFAPLSRMIVLGDDQHPLEKAFQLFKEDSARLGANAVIGIRCCLSPDNKRALIIGTPVRCEKN